MKKKIKISLGSIAFGSLFFGLGVMGAEPTSLFNQTNNNLQQSNLNSQYLEDETLNFDKIVQIEVGSNHSAALTTDGEVYTWGSDSHGQLGNGPDKNDNVHSPEKISFTEDVEIQQISLGSEHSAALTTEGEVYTWGNNNYGQLGVGSNVGLVHTPTKIDFKDKNGKVEVSKIEQISMGNSHSAALTESGEVYTWGDNRVYQLGLGYNEGSFVYLPSKIEDWRGINEGENISQIDMGTYTSAAVTSEGELYTWGTSVGNQGQLGNGWKGSIRVTPWKIEFNKGDKISQVSMTMWHSSALTTEGKVYTWGDGNDGRLGNGDTRGHDVLSPRVIQFKDLDDGEKINQINLSRNSSSAATTNGKAYTWGGDQYQQLGNGPSKSNVYSPQKISFEEGDEINELVIGEIHGAAVTKDGEVYTWGSNEVGQLGNGQEGRTEVVSPEKIFFPAYFYKTSLTNDLVSYSTDGKKLSIDLKVGNSDRKLNGSLNENLSILLEVTNTEDEFDIIEPFEYKIEENIPHDGKTITFDLGYELLSENTEYKYTYTLLNSSIKDNPTEGTFTTDSFSDLINADITIKSDYFGNSNAFIKHTYHHPDIASEYISSVQYNVLYKDGTRQILSIDMNPTKSLELKEHNFELDQNVSNVESYTIDAKSTDDTLIELDKEKVVPDGVKEEVPGIPIEPTPLPIIDPPEAPHIPIKAPLIPLPIVDPPEVPGIPIEPAPTPLPIIDPPEAPHIPIKAPLIPLPIVDPPEVPGIPIEPPSLIPGIPIEPPSLIPGIPIEPPSLIPGIPIEPPSLIPGIPIEPPLIQLPIVDPPEVPGIPIEPPLIQLPIVDPPEVPGIPIEPPLIQLPIVDPPEAPHIPIKAPLIPLPIVDPPEAPHIPIEPPLIQLPIVDPPEAPHIPIEPPLIQLPIVDPPEAPHIPIEPPLIQLPIVDPPEAPHNPIEPPLIQLPIVDPEEVPAAPIKDPLIPPPIVEPTPGAEIINSGLTWWAWLLISLGIVLLGIGSLGLIFFKKKNKS